MLQATSNLCVLCHFIKRKTQREKGARLLLLNTICLCLTWLIWLITDSYPMICTLSFYRDVGVRAFTISVVSRRQSLTHLGRDKMTAIFQTTVSNEFSCMIMLEFRLKFHWSLFLRVQLSIVHHWFRWWLGAVQATSHYLKQWWLVYRRIYVSLGLDELSDVIWKKSRIAIPCMNSSIIHRNGFSICKPAELNTIYWSCIYRI